MDKKYSKNFNKLQLTIITDNNSNGKCISEHGFSILIETVNKTTLFDTGQGDAFIKNMDLLSLPPTQIDNLIISHGHYDHTGNISYLLNIKPEIKIYAHPLITKARYSIHKDRDPKVRMIGLTKENNDAVVNSNLIKCSTPTTLESGLNITGEIPRESIEDTGGPFFFDPNGNEIDTIPDDLALYLVKNNKLIIITGCCHSGIINTIEYIKKITGIVEIETIIGGFHLLHASEDRLKRTIEYLNNQNIKTLYPGHCTGEDKIELLKKNLNCKVNSIYAGLKLSL